MIGIISDIGTVRKLNEDYAIYHEGKDYKIYVVADGMGGHNAGEIASKMAAEGVLEYISQNVDIIEHKILLRSAIEKVNIDIFNKSAEVEACSGMGTTITACLVVDDTIYVANVGDSSCFGYKNEKLIKVTKDHSLVQELLDSGSISEDEAINHPKKNIITRAVGTNKELNVDIFEIEKGQYNSFILCSDGLSNVVTKEEIISIMEKHKDFQKKCVDLVETAKKNGSSDNITVLLFGGED